MGSARVFIGHPAGISEDAAYRAMDFQLDTFDEIAAEVLASGRIWSTSIATLARARPDYVPSKEVIPDHGCRWAVRDSNAEPPTTPSWRSG